jgi:hypothetical protein
MKYATGLNASGEDGGLVADVTGMDVLHDLISNCVAHDGVIVSALPKAFAIPTHLEGMRVLGVLNVQADDKIVGDSVYVIREEGTVHEADRLLLTILELDSAGTGVACKVIPVMHTVHDATIEYARMDTDGTLSTLVF